MLRALMLVVLSGGFVSGAAAMGADVPQLVEAVQKAPWANDSVRAAAAELAPQFTELLTSLPDYAVPRVTAVAVERLELVVQDAPNYLSDNYRNAMAQHRLLSLGQTLASLKDVAWLSSEDKGEVDRRYEEVLKSLLDMLKDRQRELQAGAADELSNSLMHQFSNWRSNPFGGRFLLHLSDSSAEECLGLLSTAIDHLAEYSREVGEGAPTAKDWQFTQAVVDNLREDLDKAAQQDVPAVEVAMSAKNAEAWYVEHQDTLQELEQLRDRYDDEENALREAEQERSYHERIAESSPERVAEYRDRMSAEVLRQVGPFPGPVRPPHRAEDMMPEREPPPAAQPDPYRYWLFWINAAVLLVIALSAWRARSK